VTRTSSKSNFFQPSLVRKPVAVKLGLATAGSAGCGTLQKARAAASACAREAVRVVLDGSVETLAEGSPRSSRARTTPGPSLLARWRPCRLTSAVGWGHPYLRGIVLGAGGSLRSSTASPVMHIFCLGSKRLEWSSSPPTRRGRETVSRSSPRSKRSTRCRLALSRHPAATAGLQHPLALPSHTSRAEIVAYEVSQSNRGKVQPSFSGSECHQ
jgi:hypothetical protein